ncbi:Transmembrane protein 107 [Trypanosoma melophagium]|uniref:Transmembrane protein 107 n=1 Tax=Trypanosoma melophagium TaxID=715481 RepID=UPI00351A2D28|nr:Transmembrane protein 107 [Trypanosoma melophagium]
MYRVSTSPFRVFPGFHPTFIRRLNVMLLIPFRLLMLVAHFTALICVSLGSEEMIMEASLGPEYTQEDYLYFRRSTDACLAASFLFLFFDCWGVVTARTLRSGFTNTINGCLHAAAAVLLIVAWNATMHVTRIWQIFYVFSTISTGLEIIALCVSYRSGMDNFY